MTKAAFALPALLAAAILAPAATAQSFEPSIEETVSTEYFDFEASDDQELYDALRNRSFFASTGEASSNMSLSHSYSQDGDACRLTGLSLTLHVEHLYPRWTNESDGPRRLRRNWARYLEAQANHQSGHVEIARRGAAIVAQRLAAIPPAPDCTTLAERIQTNFRALGDALEVSHENYDDETDHGRTQGVYFEIGRR